MKRIMKIIVILFLGLQTVNVKAATTYKGRLYEVWHPDSGFSVFAEEKNRVLDYNSWMIKSTIDDRIYYCIEPGIPLSESKEGEHTYLYGLNEMIKNSDLTEEKYKKINLLAYYGYGYKDESIDHTNKKWYGITQVMIWRIMRPDLTWTFKESRNEEPNKNLYQKEVNEINDLISKHYILPSFYTSTNNPLKVLLGESKTFIDINNVIHKYTKYTTNSTYSSEIQGDKLIITGKTQTKSALSTFKIDSRTNDNYALFASNDYQDVIVLGQPIDNYLSITVEVTGGIVNIEKVDEQTEKNKPQGEATLKGAIYEVLDNKKNKVGEIITDENGQGKISLDYGTYTLKETIPPKGYKLSSKEYEVEVSENKTNQTIEATEKVITGKLKIVKTKGGTGEQLTPETNATFDIINSKGKVIEEIKTNEKGIAIKELPYGTYTLHQTSGEEGYIFAKDITIKMYEDKIYEQDIINLKPSKLIFTKLDYSTSKPVPNTLIEIYKEKQNENEEDKLIFTGKTNNKGQIEIKELEIGKYYIIEKAAPEYYKINTEKQYFEVTENGKIIKSTMINHRKEGSLIFNKTNMQGKKLKDVEIAIYFTETNKKIYTKKTNKNGQIKINKLPLGEYCLYEIKAPKGYQRYKEKTCFKLKKENDTVYITMKNKAKEKVSIPNTIKNKKNSLLLIGIITIVTGVSYLIYNVKKN